jgi:Zn finger protein HypA/HybF involved in hydrogenase expression
MKWKIIIQETLNAFKRGRMSSLPNTVKYYSRNSKPCKQCRKSFTFIAHNTLYCKSCKQKRRTISYRHSKRRQRSLDVQKVAL